MALAWVLDDTEAAHRYSADVAQLGLTGADTLAAPRLITTECVLLRRGRARKWGAVLTAEYGEVIDAIPMRLYRTLAPISSQVRFALQHGGQGYDAVYVALAVALGAKIATLDGGMKTAARAAGVAIF
ncbi:MAG TPA: type II toxin-antitoxin system VapC family toxin [Burkholderiaceae bacterium]|nr:type II toxin-antitoxin system VapC family toxin [Burkholderiaceae bacterium]